MSPKMQKALGIVFCMLLMSMGQLIAQQLNYAEYFFNNDPGKGNGIPLVISPGNTSDISLSIPSASLAAGIHTLFIRYCDTNGKWTLAEGRNIMVMNNAGTAQDNISSGEYFFNTDPGQGNGLPLSFTAGIAPDFLSNFSTASLSAGVNNLFVRLRNSSGHWSLAEKRVFYVIKNLSGTQNITQAEYFFNNDPGFGNAVSLSLSPDALIDLSQAFATSGLSSGVHHLYIRVKNTDGRWSLAESRTFFLMKTTAGSKDIVAAEYFFNSDPGFGNGTAVSISPSTEINLTEIVPGSSLVPGINRLYFRVKNVSGLWSQTERRNVIVQQDGNQKKIIALEYFIDTDPGIGHATRVNLTSADSLDHIYSFAHSIPDTFQHTLYNRVLDASGKWSAYASVDFRLDDCILPVADFSVNNICDGEQIVLHNTSLYTDTATVYKWDVLNDGSWDYFSSDSVVLSFPSPGNYQVKLRVSNCVCYDTIIKTITVYPNPAATISAYGSTSFCQGGSLVLSANTGIGYQYEWFRNDTLIPLANGAFYQTGLAGNYKLRVSNIHGCKTFSDPLTANVLPLPDVNVVPSGPLSFCDGQNVSLQANAQAGNTYQWIRNGAAISGAVNSSITASLAGNYSVYITNSNNCSATSADLSVVVNNLPLATLAAGGPTTICQGENLVLYAGNGPGYSFEWLQNGVSMSGVTSNFLNITQSGGYKVVVTNPLLCKDTSSQINATVNPVPQALIQLTGNSTICLGDSVQLKAMNISGLNFQWKNNGVVFSGLTDSVIYVKQSGNYSLMTTNAFNCSSESPIQTIIVNPLPGSGIIPAGALTFCEGDSVNLFAPAGSGLTYQWNKNGLALSGDTLNNYIAKSSGFYSVVVTNSFNCSVQSAPLSITVHPVPTPMFSLVSEACLTDTLTLTYTGNASQSAVYNWNIGTGIVVSGNGQGPIQIRWANGGLKTVSLSVFENGCTSVISTKNVNIKSVTAVISAPVTSVCQGDSIVLTANTGTNLTYQWLSGGIPLPAKNQPWLIAFTSGMYSVEVTDTVLGCTQQSQSTGVNVFTNSFSLAFNTTSARE